MKKIFVIAFSSIFALSVFALPIATKAAAPQILTCSAVIPGIATYDCTRDNQVPYAIEIGQEVKFEGIKVQNSEGNWNNNMPTNPDWQILTYVNGPLDSRFTKQGAISSGPEEKTLPPVSVALNKDYLKPGDNLSFVIYFVDNKSNSTVRSITALTLKAASPPPGPGPTGGPCQTTAECKSGEICDFSTSTCVVVGASSPVTTVSGVDSLIRSVVRWIAILISIIAVIFIILGGVSYLTAGGDAEKAKGARQKIIYGLIGLAVAALAWGAEALVRSVLKLGQ